MIGFNNDDNDTIMHGSIHQSVHYATAHTTAAATANATGVQSQFPAAAELLLPSAPSNKSSPAPSTTIAPAATAAAAASCKCAPTPKLFDELLSESGCCY